MENIEINVKVLLSKNYQNIELTEKQPVSPTDTNRIDEFYDEVFLRLHKKASKFLNVIDDNSKEEDYQNVLFFFLEQNEDKKIKKQILSLLEKDDFRDIFLKNTREYLFSDMTEFDYFFISVYGTNEDNDEEYRNLYNKMKEMYNSLPF